MVQFKALRDLYASDKAAWSESDISHFVYINRFNEVKPYAVLVMDRSKEHASVFDLNDDKGKTFTLANILAECSTAKEAADTASQLQAGYEIIPRNKTGKTFANPDKKPEVCFTGFPAKEKERLIKLAEEKGYFVRTKVTLKLQLLVCGETAGWSKLQQAANLNVAKVFGSEGFENFVETGEVAE